MDMPEQRLIIDMVSDFVCPWCFIGKRSLDRAAAALSLSQPLVVRYRPYFLAPDTPPEGRDRQAAVAEKFPDPETRRTMTEALTEAARQAGLDFDPGAPQHLPNTLDAHRVMRWAHLAGRHQYFAETAFAGYWLHGADLGEAETLARLAGIAGMDQAETARRLATDEDRADTAEEAAAFRAGGVDGVPTFIVNEQSGFAGALPPAELLENLTLLARETAKPA